MSWKYATAFAKWMDCRLPTEAEWEYAACGGTSTPCYTGNSFTAAQANYDGRSSDNKNVNGEFRKKILPVGSFAANAFALFDMHGNVWEWCSDLYGNYSTSAQANPQGATSGKYCVRRGGGWNDIVRRCRAAYRDNCSPAFRDYSIGIRLVTSR